MKPSSKQKYNFVYNLMYFMTERGGTYGMTQQELANNIGVGQTTVSSWMSGEKFPREKTLQRIADFFDVSVSVLIDSSIQLEEAAKVLSEGDADKEKAILAELEKEDVYNEYFEMRADRDEYRAALIEAIESGGTFDKNKFFLLAPLLERQGKKNASQRAISAQETKERNDIEALMACYQALNDKGKGKVKTYAYDLSQLPYYRKVDDE